MWFVNILSDFQIRYLLLFVQPPQPLLKRVTKVNVSDELCLKMKVNTGAGQRAVKTSGRRIQSKLLPPSVSTLDDKEVLCVLYFLWLKAT